MYNFDGLALYRGKFTLMDVSPAFIMCLLSLVLDTWSWHNPYTRGELKAKAQSQRTKQVISTQEARCKSKAQKVLQYLVPTKITNIFHNIRS